MGGCACSRQQHHARGVTDVDVEALTIEPKSKRRRSAPQRSDYFDRKCIIKAALSLNTESVEFSAWSSTDPDVAHNFYVATDEGRYVVASVPGYDLLNDQKYTEPLTDSGGTLTLSIKQHSKISAWLRIPELLVPSYQLADDGVHSTVVLDDAGNKMRAGSPLCPHIMREVPTAISIRQGFVGDCSFLSSLASLAEYELRTDHRILKNLIFPQDPATREPLINPFGMYGCRLYFNGCYRKVLVDDFVPVKRDGRLLSAHANNRRDMWVTILEKAFIKLAGGGYYMHGSNPAADLFHLTGWLPETIPFKKSSSDFQQPQERTASDGRSGIETGALDDIHPDTKWDEIWKDMYRGFVQGLCVVCLGTSDVPDSAPSGLEFVEGVSISSGIVAKHAYGVINMIEHRNLKLLYVRNPWSVIRWKLEFSPDDNRNWTKDLERLCNYSAGQAKKLDDGCFWIQWKDVIKWFSHLYICWNSNLLKYQYDLSRSAMRSGAEIWGSDPLLRLSILNDDTHLVLYNPQYRLKVAPLFVSNRNELKALEKEQRMYLMRRLARRVEDSRDQNAAKKFVSTIWVLLSRHLGTSVHVNTSASAAMRYVACHIFRGTEHQVCATSALHQGVYSNGECVLVKVEILRPIVLGSESACLVWDTPTTWADIARQTYNDQYNRSRGATTLQSSHCATFLYNPQILSKAYSSSTSDQGTRSESRCLDEDEASLEGTDFGQQVGANTTCDDYILVISQYGQKSVFDFSLRVHCDDPVAVMKLPPLVQPGTWQTMRHTSHWTRDNAGGCSNDLWEYFRNPHYRLQLPVTCDVVIILESNDAATSLGLRIFPKHFASPRALRSSAARSSGSYRQGACCIQIKALPAGDYTIIPSTFMAGHQAKYQLICHAKISDDVMETVDGRNARNLQNDVMLSDGRFLGSPTSRFNVLKMFAIPYPFCRDERKVCHVVKNNGLLQRRFILRGLKTKVCVSVRLQIQKRTLVETLWPSLTLLSRSAANCDPNLLPLPEARFRWWLTFGDEFRRDQSGSKSVSSGYETVHGFPSGMQSARRRTELGILSYSDIEGGLSDNRVTPSSAAARLYTKYNLACLSCATLYTQGVNNEFYLDVNVVPPELAQSKDKSSARHIAWQQLASQARCSYVLTIMACPNELQVREL